MDKAIILSKISAARMSYNMEWDCCEASKLGLRNPWHHRPDQIIDTKVVLMKLAGQEVPACKTTRKEANEEEMRLWKEERDKYIELRNGFICEKILEEFGYEAFVEECYFQHREDLLQIHFPCESADSQCNFFCPIYHDCRIRLN